MLDWMIYFKANGSRQHRLKKRMQATVSVLHTVSEARSHLEESLIGRVRDARPPRIECTDSQYSSKPSPVAAWGTDRWEEMQNSSCARYSFAETNKQVFYSICRFLRNRLKTNTVAPYFYYYYNFNFPSYIISLVQICQAFKSTSILIN